MTPPFDQPSDQPSDQPPFQPDGRPQPGPAAEPTTPGYAAPGYQPTGYQPTGYQPTGYAPTGYTPVGYSAQPWWEQQQPYWSNAPYPVQPTPPAARGRLAVLFSKPRTKVALGLAAALIVGAGGGVGITAAATHDDTVTAGAGNSVTDPSNGTGTGTGGTGQLPQGTFPGPAIGNGSQAGTSSSVSASATQSVGVVDINTVDGYQGAQAAGTGLVLTSNGEILTNNHVVDGATKISVTVVSTQATYTAKVVGTSPTNDIAVLQLTNASGLKTAKIGDSDSVDVGEKVTGVGNAGGDGGTPSAAVGKVTALNKSVTASDESGSGSETLTGVIVTDAKIQAGDSGGPLYDADNTVVGIDTAAATDNTGATTAGYAIPINHALSVAKQIESGQETSTIHIGYPAFLGVGFAQSTGAPTVSQVYQGSPAAQAGLAAGDVITAVDGSTVRTYAQLHAKIATFEPGDSIKIAYTDASGAARTAKVTLTTGPAD